MVMIEQFRGRPRKQNLDHLVCRKCKQPHTLRLGGFHKGRQIYRCMNKDCRFLSVLQPLNYNDLFPSKPDLLVNHVT